MPIKFASSFKPTTSAGIGIQNLVSSMGKVPTPAEQEKLRLESAYKQAQVDKLGAETTGITNKNDAIGGIGDVIAKALSTSGGVPEGGVPLTPQERIAKLGPEVIQQVVSAGGGNAMQIGNSIGPVLNAITSMTGDDETARRGLIAAKVNPTAAFATTPERADDIRQQGEDAAMDRAHVAAAARMASSNAIPGMGRIPQGYMLGPDGKSLVKMDGYQDQKTKYRPLPDKAIGNLSAASNKYDDFSRLVNTFDSKYGGQPFGMGTTRNAVGLITGDSSGQAQWWQDYQEQKNKIRHDLFGSALTDPEKNEFEKVVVTPGMDPKEIQKNLTRQQAIAERAMRKLAGSYRVGNFYDPAQIDALMNNGNSQAAPVDPTQNVPTAGITQTPHGLSQGGPVQVQSKAEAMKLPSGTQFLDPNGVLRTRP